MKRKRTTFAVLAFALILPHVTFCFTGVSAAQSTAMKVKIGQDAPDFTLKTLDGREVSLSEYKGKKVVMLEFWATWCNICVKEIPNLIKNYEDFKDRGFELLGITLQSGDDEEIQQVIDDYRIPYPVLVDERLKVATKIYGLSGPIPLKVVVGCNGKVEYAHVGDYPPGEDEIPFVLEDLTAQCKE